MKDGHLEALPIERFHRAYRIQLGSADGKRIDAIADTQGARKHR
jgi:hypothetical protein